MKSRTLVLAVFLALFLAACGNLPPNTPSSNPGTAFAPPALSTPSTAPTLTHTPQSTSLPAPPTGTPKLSSAADALLEEALEIMEANALYRERVDWQAVREQAILRASGAQDPDQVYPAIRYALEQLQDGHSFVLPPEEFSAITSGDRNSRNIKPSGKLLEGQLAYINMPGIRGSESAFQDYAQTLQSLIRELDQEQPCGWIIDLTGNSGGNMWPMLAGIGPLLGEGRVGAFVDAGGKSYHWYYQDGQAGVEGTAGGRHEQGLQFQLNVPAYQLQGSLPPVAVLTSGDTASSGEAAAVAFRGRTNTRSFGLPTHGVSTSNELFELSDGGALLLTTSRFADRDGQVYGGPIAPDVEVTASLQVRQAAADWLLSLPECK